MMLVLRKTVHSSRYIGLKKVGEVSGFRRIRMDIVIIAQYLGDLEHLETTNGRFIYLAKMLAERNKVEIITTTFPHSLKRQAKFVPDSYEGCKITALYEPGYSKNVCLKRFVSHYRLARNVERYLNHRKKPDIIYAAVPSLSVASVAAKFCRKNSVRFIVDIQDLWPEAFKMVFHLPVISDLVFLPMQKQADFIYSSADEIVAVSKTYADRALCVSKKCKEAKVVYLGTDKNIFDKWASQLEFQSKSKAETGRKALYQKLVRTILKEKSWQKIVHLVYIGTLGHSYDISTILSAIRKLPDKDRKKLQFVIMGDGPKKKQFQKEAKGLPVIFTGMVEYPEMVWLLCHCDIAINPIQKGAAQSIINKHMDYAMSGLPVISTQECDEYEQLLAENRCGINCICGNSSSVRKAIKHLIDHEELRKEMGRRHREVAERLFDRGQSYKNITNIIEDGKGR